MVVFPWVILNFFLGFICLFVCFYSGLIIFSTCSNFHFPPEQISMLLFLKFRAEHPDGTDTYQEFMLKKMVRNRPLPCVSRKIAVHSMDLSDMS